MATVTCDPTALDNAARCYASCIPMGFHISVQSYLIAQIALAKGAISNADPQALLTASNVWWGTVPTGEAMDVQNYLLCQLNSGLNCDPSTLQQTLACWAECGADNMWVQTYLLANDAANAGAGNSTDPSTLVSLQAVSCFNCTVPLGSHLALQNYVLAQIVNPSLSANDAANAARCWMTCSASRSALRSYLLCQLAGCTAPLAPTNLTVTLTTGTTITFSWSQPLNIPPVTISSYTVKWGTVAGVYTNEVMISGSLSSYTITGLTASTSYFIVIQAFSGLCASSNSAQLSTSTSSGSNQLLQSLISYWKFDVNVSPYADSVGGNPLTGASTSAGVVAGIINGGLDLSLGNSQASHTDNTDFSPAANTSFAFSFWVSASNWSSTPGFPIILIKGNGAGITAYQVRLDTTGQAFNAAMWDSGSTVFVIPMVSGGFPTNNVFHHVVLSFDSTNKLFTAYYDGALSGSMATNTGSVLTNALDFRVGVGAGNGSITGLKLDEMAMWHKRLVQADVTNLYNGGAGLPLASYQA